MAAVASARDKPPLPDRLTVPTPPGVTGSAGGVPMRERTITKCHLPADRVHGEQHGAQIEQVEQRQRGGCSTCAHADRRHLVHHCFNAPHLVRQEADPALQHGRVAGGPEHCSDGGT